MTPLRAKKIIKLKLDELGLKYEKLTARTINFSDLTRASCVFVKVHGWKPNPQWEILQLLAKNNDFRVEA
jgi:hypothetical protein